MFALKLLQYPHWKLTWLIAWKVYERACPLCYSVFRNRSTCRLYRLLFVLFIYNTDKNTLAHQFETELSSKKARIPQFRRKTMKYDVGTHKNSQSRARMTQ